MFKSIYLDNNATTALADEVEQTLLPLYRRCLNPSSVHSYGREAKKYVENAREEIAESLHVDPKELFFTSGGTESMNTLIRGLYPGYGEILSTKVEHSCVFETLEQLKNNRVPVHYLPVGREGAPSLEAIEASLSEKVSMMVFSAVYSETGAMIDLKEVAKIALNKDILLVIDGVALLGKEEFTIPEGVNGMGFSSHKLHGPRGVGLCFVSSKSQFQPLLVGGHQEGGKRAGTENVEGIVGFAKAVSLLKHNLNTWNLQMKQLREEFENLLKTHLSIQVNCGTARVCNTSNILFHNIDGETLLLSLERKGIYASMGSACSSGAIEPSRILLNMGLSRKEAKSSIRFSFSRKTTKDEIQHAANEIIALVKRLENI